jgi:outer membrane protein
VKTIKHGALHLVTLLSALGFTGTFAGAALADEPPNDVRVGLYSVFYHTSADDLSGPYVPPGVNLKAENLETLYLGYVRHLPDNFAVELAFGYPPRSKIKGVGPATVGSVPYNGQVIASARWISPTLLFEYNFLSDQSPIRPYLGVGVNYTTFHDRDSTAQGNAASGGPTRLSLTASVGPAVTGGLTYRITDRWHLHASYSWSQVKTNLTADTDGFIRTSRISFGPQALVISGGYSF